MQQDASKERPASAGPWARKLMVPLGEYGIVDLDGTLEDALVALAQAQKKAEPGCQPHRAVLVQGRGGAFVGKLGYHAILSALRPEQKTVVLDESLRQAGVSEDMVEASRACLELFHQELPSLCDRACHLKVRDMLLSEPASVSADASIDELIDIFLKTEAHSLLVLDGRDVLGVLRVADLFDAVTSLALEQSIAPTQCEEP